MFVKLNFLTFVHFFRNLRKCGKKMPRYCDVNNDKTITLSEWLNCLQSHQTTSAAVDPLKPASKFKFGYAIEELKNVSLD